MPKKNVYKLLFSFEAPDVKKSESAGKLITEYFEEGENVIGEYYKKDNIIVEDRFIIPLDYVEETKEFPYLKKHSRFDETIDRIKQQSVLISQKESDRLQEFGSDVKNTIEGKKVAQLQNEAKSYKNGALLGLGIGIITALYLKRNVWVISLLGVAIGGYVAHKINKAKQGNNIVEPIS